MAKKLNNQKRRFFHIKKNDKVRVLAGKNVGKDGKVLKVLHKSESVIVEGVNFIKRHQRASQKQQKGGIIEKEGPIHISNVMLVCSKCNRPARVGHHLLADGGNARVCRKCGEVLDK